MYLARSSRELWAESSTEDARVLTSKDKDLRSGLPARPTSNASFADSMSPNMRANKAASSRTPSLESSRTRETVVVRSTENPRVCMQSLRCASFSVRTHLNEGSSSTWHTSSIVVEMCSFKKPSVERFANVDPETVSLDTVLTDQDSPQFCLQSSRTPEKLKSNPRATIRPCLAMT